MTAFFAALSRAKLKPRSSIKTSLVVAFNDIGPKAPVHILIIPRKHIAGVLDITEDDGAVIAEIFHVAARLAGELGIADRGFRVVVNSGPDSGQSVFHLHYHLLGGRQMSWPPG